MSLKLVRLFSATAMIAFSLGFHVASVHAQGQGGIGTGTGTGTGGFGTGATTGTGATGGTSGGTSGNTGGTGTMGALDANASFSGVSRGATVGSTGATGLGFSDLSVGAQGGSALGGAGARGGFGGLGGLGGLGGMFGGAGFGANTQTAKPPIRTRLRSAVETPNLPSGYVQQNANRNLQSVSSRAGMRGVGVVVDNGTAVVTGVVRNEHDRRMSELLMRLEPGVRQVENRVIVSP